MVSTKDWVSNTPLVWAARNRREGIVKILRGGRYNIPAN